MTSEQIHNVLTKLAMPYNPQLEEYRQMVQGAQQLAQQRAGPQWSQNHHAMGAQAAREAYGIVEPGIKPSAPTTPRQPLPMAPLGRVVGRR